MTDLNPDTWQSRDLPVLKAIVREADSRPGDLVYLNKIRAATGFDQTTVIRAVAALEGDGYIAPVWSPDFEGPSVDWLQPGVSGEARRAVGAWPTPETGVDRLIAALEHIAENTEDDEERTRLHQFASFLKSSGKQVGLGVVTAVLTGQVT